MVQLPSKKITVEIRSLNSKNLDINARVPSAYREKELDIRTKIAKALIRGKVDFNLFVEMTGKTTTAQLNKGAVHQYIGQLKEIVNGDETELLKMAVRMPDALITQREEIDETEIDEIFNALNQALLQVNTYRSDEGAVLKTDFLNRVQTIQTLLGNVLQIDAQRIDRVRERLRRAVSELNTKVDENRFEQELIYYLEKYDITEEKVRLQNHLEYFCQAVNSTGSNGKKLGFIVQEMGREINTIGSKSNFAPMQQLVVQMKDELEKIKEQALNVL